MTAPCYADDNVALYHGDCRPVDEWLAGRVLVTDPPYGINQGVIGPRLGGNKRTVTSTPVRTIEGDTDTCPPGLVVDPFAGSGATLRAAKDLGRQAIGIELEERYCEIAARSLAQEVLAL